MITVGSLFSGIGGIDLGLERTGSFKTIWFSEVDEYASAVLRKHWPEVPNYGDIKAIPWRKIRKPDMLVGGFPCQDISIAGKGAGIKEGTRSGLWSEYAKAIRILRPKYALIENVPMLANRGLNVVLSDLAKIGYDAQWNIISAASVGAWHKRERIFLLAYSSGFGCGKMPIRELDQSSSDRTQVLLQKKPATKANIPNFQSLFSQRLLQRQREIQSRRGSWWEAEPHVGRVVDGLPARVDRIKCLGNAVVPQVAETLGYWIRDFIEAT